MSQENSPLNLRLTDDETRFYPGEELTGTAEWRLHGQPDAVELRLFWFTRGKGTEDVKVVDVQRFESPAAQEARGFRFTAPAEPYSFSGKLISLVWALELVTLPNRQTQRVEITISPTAEEIDLRQPSAVT